MLPPVSSDNFDLVMSFYFVLSYPVSHNSFSLLPPFWCDFLLVYLPLCQLVFLLCGVLISEKNSDIVSAFHIFISLPLCVESFGWPLFCSAEPMHRRSKISAFLQIACISGRMPSNSPSSSSSKEMWNETLSSSSTMTVVVTARLPQLANVGQNPYRQTSGNILFRSLSAKKIHLRKGRLIKCVFLKMIADTYTLFEHKIHFCLFGLHLLCSKYRVSFIRIVAHI